MKYGEYRRLTSLTETDVTYTKHIEVRSDAAFESIAG